MTNSNLPKQYDHKEAEKRWQEQWEAKKIYAWKNDQPREETFVIDTPPPTVSGILHMGHIFSYTQADFVARFQRMIGKDVFYPMGFDDNGLPTERLVEKSKKVRATDMSREDFIKLCMGVSEEARKEFRDLFTSVALSVDWAQEYHTISEHSRRISQESFLDLYNKGHAYRELKPFFWDPVDQTAIAQAEIVDKEMPSFFNDILFGVEGSDEKITIATTRPELIPACVGVFYHPDDKRYQHLKGKNAITPLFSVKVPILEDDSVEMEKGTGIMMCCTFGDEKDIEKWKKHKLAARVILNKYGKIDETFLKDALKGVSFDFAQTLVGKKTSNNDPKNLGAREAILAELKDKGLLTKSDPITHAVKCAERSGAPLEILPTDQWFVRVMDKKAELKAKSDACNWHPEWMKHRMDQWIDGLASDWCISRQRYFGVPFPVWFSKRAGEEGKIIVADAAQLPVNPLVDLPKGYTRDEVEADKDVMDTWATSSVSPQISAGGIHADNFPHPTPLPEGEGVRKVPLPKGEGVLNTKKPSPPGRGLGEGGVKKLPLSDEFLSRVKALRQNATDAESYLWAVLRDRQLQGFKFRRQHPIAPYVVDFYSHEANLVIELDGGQHNEEANQKRDEGRTKYLESKGLTVIRFWNNEVLENMEGVYQAIADTLPHPALSQRERVPETRFSKLFPADLRPQAHEIIRTWAFYTIVKAHLHTGTVPWHNLMISGWCLAADKTKMSKSKGNVITPVDLIIDKGADVVRYWASTSRLGADTAFSEDLLKIGRKLTTKLWNATAFAAIHLSKIETAPTTAAQDIADKRITEALDLWILSRLTKTVSKATNTFAAYEYCDARVAIEEFFWKDFCDNYLELVKARAYGEIGDANASASAHLTLHHCLNTILRLFAPFIPHVTEELYSHIFAEEYAKSGSLHARGMWPKGEDYSIHQTHEDVGIRIVAILEAVRKFKSESNVSIKYPIEQAVLSHQDQNVLDSVKPALPDLLAAGNIKQLDVAAWNEGSTDGIHTATEGFHVQRITLAAQADVD
jgi:valyl-tRNA synthetase